jgi:hypothetical protein
MSGINIPHIAFGCLVKPLAAAFAAHAPFAGASSRVQVVVRSERVRSLRLKSRGLMEGPFDGNASFNASRYRCS